MKRGERGISRLVDIHGTPILLLLTITIDLESCLPSTCRASSLARSMGTLSLATITFKDLASTNWSGLLTSWNPYLWNGNTVYPYDGNYQPAHGLRAYIQPNVIHKEVRPCLAKIIAAFGLFRTARSMSHRALLLDPNADHGTQPPRTRLDNLVLVYGSSDAHRAEQNRNLTRPFLLQTPRIHDHCVLIEPRLEYMN
ncbi:hypothetical protein B0H16DRAFT_1445729 [Mycena metata]|uniref:Uncharacterized protein n=1 Tax=Mycena metata TaxID=1033252 RepID=A0AAD7KH94_9AGAR|nr:hypothetical protein B0H16DRAFT_1445729 [Mycena metata]